MITITNLIAAVVVSIVTNTTQWTDESGCPYHGQPHFYNSLAHFENCHPYHPATHKTETTEVVEITTIKIDPEQLEKMGWKGGMFEGSQKRVLSTKTKTFKRTDKWEEVIAYTNVNYLTY